MKQETGGKNGKMKKSGREFLFHYFDLGKSNLVFHTVSNNSWISIRLLLYFAVSENPELKVIFLTQ